MRLVFEPDEGAGFEAAKAWLLDALASWLQAGRGLAADETDAVVSNAGLALDWKWSYGDGHLGRWHMSDVAEFLLEWCPRKLSVSEEDCDGIPSGVARLIEYLDEHALLVAGSSPAPQLAETVTAMTAEFVDAMGDSSRFGMAKSLFGAAAADGVDLSDQADLERWMADFNARPQEERHRIIPDSALGIRRSRPKLPAVAMPDDEEVFVSAAAAPVLEMFRRIADFVGEGRKLTQRGNLTLADARVLVALLGTGDVMDQHIGDQTFKTKSSAELPRLRQVFAWAKKAGVVRVVRGSVATTKRGKKKDGDPMAAFDRAASALLEIGPLASQRDSEGWFAWPEVTELLDHLTVLLLSGPYAAQRPVPIDDIAVAAADSVLQAFEFPALSDEQVAKRIAVDVLDLFDALELAGIVVRSEVDEAETGHRRTGGRVALTPAGVATARRLLLAAGYDAPTAGRFANASAVEFLVETDTLDFPDLLGELEAWRRRRAPEIAAKEIANAIRGLEDPALRNLAFAVLTDIGVEISEPLVRDLAAEPATSGFARCWLVDHGLEEPATLLDDGGVDSFIDVLAHRLVTGGPEGLVDTLALTGNHDDQIALIGRLWRVASPATGPVLEGIGKTHPVRVIAKAARKAALQHRSWLSNR